MHEVLDPFLHAEVSMKSRYVLLAAAGLACGDDAQCVVLPCPLSEAAAISVTAANAPAGIAGLTETTTGVVLSSGQCNQGAISVCHILGPAGQYQVTLTAPGYKPAIVTFAVTGVDAGCNTCGHVDRQQLSVVLEPAT